MSELEKCPFCGGDEIIRSVDGGIPPDHCEVTERYVTTCTLYCECGAQVQGFGASNSSTNGLYRVAVDECYKAWNTRAPVEYDGWFYLPKPKENIVQYGAQCIEKTENGYKMQQPVEVIESAARAWGNELGEHIMERICEVWNARAERTCRDTGESRLFRCSECGFGIEDAYLANEGAYGLELDFVRFCPSCGRKVVNHD